MHTPLAFRELVLERLLAHPHTRTPLHIPHARRRNPGPAVAVAAADVVVVFFSVLEKKKSGLCGLVK